MATYRLSFDVKELAPGQFIATAEATPASLDALLGSGYSDSRFAASAHDARAMREALLGFVAAKVRAHGHRLSENALAA